MGHRYRLLGEDFGQGDIEHEREHRTRHQAQIHTAGSVGPRPLEQARIDEHQANDHRGDEGPHGAQIPTAGEPVRTPAAAGIEDLQIDDVVDAPMADEPDEVDDDPRCQNHDQDDHEGRHGVDSVPHEPPQEHEGKRNDADQDGGGHAAQARDQ